MPRIFLLVLCVTVGAATACGSEPAPQAAPPPPPPPPVLTVVADSCLPPSELTIGPIFLGQTANAAVGSAGRPTRIVRDTSVRADGERVELARYKYAGLEFDLSRGRVIRVRADAIGREMPTGVRAGLWHDQVNAMLGMRGVRLPKRADTIDVRGCGDSGSKLQLVFDSLGALGSVTLLAR